MAIAPNTTFTSGAILTAAQMNALPFGNVAYASSGTRLDGQAAEVLSPGMSVTFTAIANRNYKITYVEGCIAQITTAGSFTMQIRLTNLAGASQSIGLYNLAAATNTSCSMSLVKTFAAGSVTLVGTGSTSAGTFNYRREINGSSNPGAYLLVEDMGPA
jgi:hypothetical protein